MLIFFCFCSSFDKLYNLPGDDRLIEVKVLIIHQAPANIRMILSLREPGKSHIRHCIDKQFLDPVLKDVLGFLVAGSIAKLTSNIILRFEALLLATCGTC